MRIEDFMGRIGAVVEEFFPNSDFGIGIPFYITEAVQDLLDGWFKFAGTCISMEGEGPLYLVGAIEDMVGFVDEDTVTGMSILLGVPKMRSLDLTYRLGEWVHEHSLELLRWMEMGEACKGLTAALEALRKEVCR